MTQASGRRRSSFAATEQAATAPSAAAHSGLSKVKHGTPVGHTGEQASSVLIVEQHPCQGIVQIFLISALGHQI